MMTRTPAAFFRTLVWLNLLCAMTLPGVVVSARQGGDEGMSRSLSAQLRPAGARPEAAPMPNGLAPCAPQVKSRLDRRH